MRKYCWFALAVPYKEQLLPSATMIVSRRRVLDKAQGQHFLEGCLERCIRLKHMLPRSSGSLEWPAAQ